MRKHPVRTAALAIVAALALSACGKSDDSAATQANTDVQAIKDAETKMQAGFKDKNVEQVVAFYASSASFFAPGQTPSKGADVLRYVFRQMLGDPAAALSFQADRVEDLARSITAGPLRTQAQQLIDDCPDNRR